MHSTSSRTWWTEEENRTMGLGLLWAKLRVQRPNLVGYRHKATRTFKKKVTSNFGGMAPSCHNMRGRIWSEIRHPASTLSEWKWCQIEALVSIVKASGFNFSSTRAYMLVMVTISFVFASVSLVSHFFLVGLEFIPIMVWRYCWIRYSCLRLQYHVPPP